MACKENKLSSGDYRIFIVQAYFLTTIEVLSEAIRPLEEQGERLPGAWGCGKHIERWRHYMLEFEAMPSPIWLDSARFMIGRALSGAAMAR